MIKKVTTIAFLALIACASVNAQAYKSLMEKGDKYFNTDRSKTVQNYEKAIEAAKTNAEKGLVCQTLANKLHIANESADAIYWHKRGAEYGDPESLCYVGNIQLSKGDYEGAIRYYKQAAEQGDPMACHQLGFAYYRTGDKQNSRIWLEKYCESFPDKNTALATIGDAFNPFGKNKEYGNSLFSFFDGFDGLKVNENYWTAIDFDRSQTSVGKGVIHQRNANSNKMRWSPDLISRSVPFTETVIVENNISDANYPTYKHWASEYHYEATSWTDFNLENIRLDVCRILYGRYRLPGVQLSQKIGGKEINKRHGTQSFYTRGTEKIVIHRSTAMLEYYMNNNKLFEHKLDDRIKECKNIQLWENYGTDYDGTWQELSSVSIECRDGGTINVEDREEAIYWYNKAIEAGLKQYNSQIARIHFKMKQYDLSDKYNLAYISSLSNVEAKSALCIKQAKDYKLEEDDARAVQWYIRAREFGDADAMNKLAKEYGYEGMVDDFDEEGEAIVRYNDRRGAVVNKSMKKIKEVDL